MNNLRIAATEYTPKIAFDAEHHLLEITGKSYPENTAAFYAPAFDWLKEYLPQLDQEEVTVNIEIIYFNSSSSKTLLDLFELLDEAAFRGVYITVNWYYDIEDEDLLEYGEEFAADFRALQFNFIARETK